MLQRLLPIVCITGILAGNPKPAKSVSGIINSYASVSAIAGTTLTVSGTVGFVPGGKVLVIQMKGASIYSQNNSAYGDITSYNNCGNFEFAYISSVTATTITLTAPLTKSYTPATGRVQVVTVPFFCELIVTDTLKCQPWNDATGTGGVLVFESGGVVTLNADIDVSRSGFGVIPACSNGSLVCNNTNYFVNPNGCNAGKKGEAIADYVSNAQSGGRGKIANGGGGSNRANSGGGGGSNYGAGGNGGWEDASCGTTIQGIGGQALNYTQGRIFLGGGGGNGQGNNGGTIYGGGTGGGIVMISAKKIVANGHAIRADGGDVTGLTVNEGAGGGGGGGVVCLDVDYIDGILHISAEGGDGGSTSNDGITADCTGPGGGGGGGVIWVSGTSLNPNITYSVNGGAAGLALGATTSCYNTNYGATAGSAGGVIYNYPPHVLPPPAVSADLGPDGSACPQEVVTLDPGVGFRSFLWQDGSTDSTLAAVGPGTYFVEVQDSLGCLSWDTVQIVGKPAYVFSIGTGDTTVCPGQPVTIDPGSWHTAYVWQDGSTNATYTTTVAGNFSVTITDSVGCEGSATYDVFHFPPSSFVISTGDTTVCPFEPVTISCPAGYASYVWQDGTSGPVYAASDSGTYKVTATDSLGCVDTSVYRVFYFPSSVVNLGNDTALCEGDSILLDAGIFPFYQWSTGDQGQTLYVYGPGTYWVTVEDFNGCVTSDTLEIPSFYPQPPSDLIQDTLICTGQVLLLLAPSGYAAYEWSTGSKLNYTNITKPGSYWLEVTNAQTCRNRDTFQVKLECPTALFVPNAFTPNGDGRNDVFLPIGYNINSFVMRIYNRWGKMVYETYDPQMGWDGYCHGVPCETGSYVYYIEWAGSLHGVDRSGTERGNVTLIR
ncbi:MAG: gliding motility-associated C-terminal domain-containing protein [Chitinophagales bacterium]|nr:gliding motility-associated C-terminal domain-containing protein [Chitinophagales bacterium]MDW8394468.1 gliding motility-associated C-terminal domain-containing protein [Chitinophagales bacterium]